MEQEAQIDQVLHCAIVVLGSFNPGILHPEWIKRFKILPDQEVEPVMESGATTSLPDGTQIPAFVASPEATQISFPTFQLKVEPSRLEFSTLKRGAFENVPQALSKIFRLLPHTPVKAVGTNFFTHMRVKEGANKILKDFFQGRRLVDKSAHNELVQVFGQSYEIWGVFRFDTENAEVTVRVEPSTLITDGVFIGYNFHRTLQDKIAKKGVLSILEKFNTDLESARGIQHFIVRQESAL